jgi:hypothetical protein
MENRIEEAAEYMERLWPWLRRFLKGTYSILNPQIENIEIMIEETMIYNEPYVLMSMLDPDTYSYPFEEVEMRYDLGNGKYVFFCYNFVEKQIIPRS